MGIISLHRHSVIALAAQPAPPSWLLVSWGQLHGLSDFASMTAIYEDVETVTTDDNRTLANIRSSILQGASLMNTRSECSKK